MSLVVAKEYLPMTPRRPDEEGFNGSKRMEPVEMNPIFNASMPLLETFSKDSFGCIKKDKADNGLCVRKSPFWSGTRSGWMGAASVILV